MLYQPATPPPENAIIIKSEDSSCQNQIDASVSQEHRVIAGTLATPTPPETLPPEFATNNLLQACYQQVLSKKVEQPSLIVSENAKNLSKQELSQVDVAGVRQNPVSDIDSAKTEIENFHDYPANKLQDSVIVPTATPSLVAENAVESNTTNTLTTVNKDTPTTNTVNNIVIEQKKPENQNNVVAQDNKTSIDKINPTTDNPLKNLLAEAKSLLLAVVVNQREIGSLEVIPEGDTLLIPLEDFVQITGLELENTDAESRIKTPLGVVSLTETDLKKINGITYVSDRFLKEKLLTNIEIKASELTLNVDFPWLRGVASSRDRVLDLQPEVKAPSNGLSSLRQELRYNNNSGRTSWRSSTLLGGRLAGGAVRLRLENNFVNQPHLTEYFFFKRSGPFLYQIGKQQLTLNPVFSGVNFTGLQFGYTNIPEDRFTPNSSASELLPRRSQPTQGFRGVVPPASLVRLRVGGVVVAQQQVGLSGEYDFQDVRLPTGQTSDIELLIFDRNNLSIPVEIRSLTLNASDLLLPSGGNLQLAGVGVTGNWVQDNLFDDFASNQPGRFTGFYQVRQGISNDLTLEAGVQVLPETTQAQAGFAWRLAGPLILAANVGTANGEVAYKADLNFRLGKWLVLATSELYPQEYFATSNRSNGRDYSNHSLDVNYKFSDAFNLGFIARAYQNQKEDSSYILPTFFLRAASNLSFRGSPNYGGDYVFSAAYQPTNKSRLSFQTYGDIYTSDFSYNLTRQYRLSLGTESGGDLATRYTLIFSRSAPSLSGLSWRLGLGYREGEIGPFVGASMRIMPGLFASIDYQGIPSRYKNTLGETTDERLTVSLISDLSFAGGRIRPAESSLVSKDRGAIAGRIFVEGGRNGLDLSGGLIQVYNNRGRSVGGAIIDAQGNFFVGNLREGNYVVQLDPNELPLEINLRKTSIVAEVAGGAVTQLNFPVSLEYGMAGRITDVSGQPMPYIELEVIDAEGKRVSTAATDQFGLYRVDGLPVGKYTLRVPNQENITNSESLPKLDVAISNDFIYEQNLRLPISAAVQQIAE
ncbi:carboxypeptidase regulatory-like domain-containing protein [Anabaena sp. CA = ATCC 33047]|uniref:carboxypeptidase regulatory-like domain-containing protein n=1 Tax=Anabaena sp. (strain CA / ATCC 33047) TaxID=52271 RepID=UPI00082CA075|nr:carboxypeptidase regulatory-like domain-containing protein [Anabaena sp. CA = ATCC 33047]